MNGLYTALGIVGGIAVLVMIIVYKIKRSSWHQALSDIKREIDNGNIQTAEEAASTPRSVGGMDSIYLPKILRDFPEFLWNEWRNRIRDAVKVKVDELGSDGKVYKTVINGYKKKAGTIFIDTKTSASYIPDREPVFDKKGDIVEQLRRQSVFKTELLYVQDALKAEGDSFAMECPRCGAPVTILGQKKCSYCNGDLEPVNIRVWNIGPIIEDN